MRIDNYIEKHYGKVPARAIAEKLKIRPIEVYAVAKRLGLMKPRESLAKRDAEIHALRAKGWTYQQIGDKFGITKQRVYQVLK